MNTHDDTAVGGALATGGRRAGLAATRSALVDAAVDVFDEVGFTDATISSISARAGRSHGSFYTYFDSKEEVFHAAVRRVNDDEVDRRGDQPEASSLEERIARTNARFIDAYRHHARLLASLEELAARNEATRDLRRSTRHRYIEKTIASIQRWQDDGVVAPDLDAEALAHCLGSMVERVAHMLVVFGDGCTDDRMMAAISDIWCGALGLRLAEGRSAALALCGQEAS